MAKKPKLVWWIEGDIGVYWGEIGLPKPGSYLQMPGAYDSKAKAKREMQKIPKRLGIEAEYVGD